MVKEHIKENIRYFLLLLVFLIFSAVVLMIFSCCKNSEPKKDQYIVLEETVMGVLIPGSAYEVFFTEEAKKHYALVENLSEQEKFYAISIANNNTNIEIGFIDSFGKETEEEKMSLSQGYVIFKIPPFSERTLFLRNNIEGKYSFDFNEFEGFLEN